MRFLLAAFLLSLAPCWAAPDLPALVHQQRLKYGLRSVLCGVWVGDREILRIADGESMSGVPATADMHFRIGGVTESMLTTTLLRLCEQGKLSLDDKLSKWFPDLPQAERVTVRMLANCSSGYPDYIVVDSWVQDCEKNPFRVWQASELVDVMVGEEKRHGMRFAPGTSQQYSHTDYIILGEVLARATGKSMAALFEENIIAPLGLQDTRAARTAELQEPVLHAYTSDRQGLYEDSTFWDPSFVSYPGMINSNLNDLHKWATALGSGSLLASASHKEQCAPLSVGLGKNTASVYFAYGFVVVHGWFFQNPSFGGYTGAFGHLPSQKLTIFVETVDGPGIKHEPFATYLLHDLSEAVDPQHAFPALKKD